MTAAAVKEDLTPARFNFYFVSPKGQKKVRSKKRRGGFDETFHHMVCFTGLPLFVQPLQSIKVDFRIKGLNER